ncbi:MAG: hypothetical protein PHO66_01630 [Eubacteriales bacterium]|nr:hypothetical protein [Eubacteriales bacterium]
MKKYYLRFSWYVLRKVLLVLALFAALLAAFFIAMDTANVYVVVTDGLKARADAILVQQDDQQLSTYFDTAFLDADMQLKAQTYQAYTISDFIYHLDVESLWCQPWKGVAKVTVVESIPDMDAQMKNADEGEPDQEVVVPAWTRGRYVLTCYKQNNRWLIRTMELVGVLEPEPTPSPEPTDTPRPTGLTPAAPTPAAPTPAAPTPAAD